MNKELQAGKNTTGQMESSPRSWLSRLRVLRETHTETPPARKTTEDWKNLKMFVVTEDDFAVAKRRRRKIGRYDCLKQCLIATTLERMGFEVEAFAYVSGRVGGILRYASPETEGLVSDFMDGRYRKVIACLPFVVEMKDGYCNLTPSVHTATEVR